MVNGRAKFVGKVGLCPADPRLPQYRGMRIFYREFPWKDVFSHATNTIGVDAQALDEAVALGAKKMVVYCKDTKQLWACDTQKLQESYALDLGERPQYRIKPDDCVMCLDTNRGLNIGYTHNVKRLAETENVVEQTIKEKKDSQMKLGL